VRQVRDFRKTTELRAAVRADARQWGALQELDAASLTEEKPTQLTWGNTTIIPSRGLNCFCLRVAVVAHVERVGSGAAAAIQVVLDGLEIIDLSPEGLENGIECYLGTLLRLVVFPKLRITLNTLVFELGSYGTLSPTPVSAAVPFNPSIAKDALSVFIDLA
jgi:hypothetical protein